MKGERLLIPLFLILVWQALCSAELIPAYKLPSPADLVGGFKDLLVVGVPPGYLLQHHIAYSLYRVAVGYLVACALAIPLGLFMGWSPTFLRMVRPVIEVIRPIPPLAWIPLAILWFGLGITSASFIIFLGAFFPILLNTISGVLSINPVLIEAARTLHAKEKDILFKVLFPGAVPSIFVGTRIGIGIGWMTLVAAEFTGVKEGYGLGYMIMTARDIQRPDEVVAGMFVIGIMGLLIDVVIRAVESRMIPWR